MPPSGIATVGGGSPPIPALFPALDIQLTTANIHEDLDVVVSLNTPQAGTLKLRSSVRLYPSPWIIFICFTTVLFPDSPAPMRVSYNGHTQYQHTPCPPHNRTPYEGQCVHSTASCHYLILYTD